MIRIRVGHFTVGVKKMDSSRIRNRHFSVHVKRILDLNHKVYCWSKNTIIHFIQIPVRIGHITVRANMKKIDLVQLEVKSELHT